MATKKPTSSPLTFDLPLELLEKIEACRRTLALRSASQVVRAALEEFDFNRYRAEKTEHRQISVRITDAHKALLSGQARRKKVSSGELVRAALAGFTPRPAKKAVAKKTKR